MLKKILLTLAALLLTFLVIAGMYALMIRDLIAASAVMVMPPEAVSLAEVREEEWETVLSAVGSVTPVQGTTVSAEAEGVVREVTFHAGAVVETGAVLVRLDTDIEESQVRSARAAADLAEANFKRARELVDSQTISQSELDSAGATLEQTRAQVDNFAAIIAKKTIRAPFAGRLGIREISLGQFLNKGQAVVVLQSFDPVFVEFSLPQQNVSQIKSGMVVRVKTDAYPEETFSGELTALNPQVEAATRSIRVQATLPNPDGRLLPGMFALVEVVLPQARPVLTVPATAVLNATYGDSVFVVESASDGKGGDGLVAKSRLVRKGEARGDFVVILSGLKAGERVVSSGGFKLRNGAAVVESSVGVAPPRLHPEVQDS